MISEELKQRLQRVGEAVEEKRRQAHEAQRAIVEGAVEKLLSDAVDLYVTGGRGVATEAIKVSGELANATRVHIEDQLELIRLRGVFRVLSVYDDTTGAVKYICIRVEAEKP